MSIRPVIAWVYDENTLSYVRMTQPGGSTSESAALTDAQLRATDVRVSLDGEVIHIIVDSSASIGVTGPLTDTQLRETPVPVSGTFYPETQPVSAVTLPLPAGAATESSVAGLTKPSDSQHATLDDIAVALRQILQALAYPPNIDRSAASARVNMTSGILTTLTTLTTCTTVTGLTNIDSIQGRVLVMGQNANAWANVVRSRIS
jgi:hypothetical protein